MKKRIGITGGFILWALILFFIVQAVVRNAVAKADSSGDDILSDFFLAITIAAEGYLAWWAVLVLSAVAGAIFGWRRNDKVMKHTFSVIAAVLVVAGAVFWIINTL